MPAPERNRWTELKDTFVQRREAVRIGLAEWWGQCREEPALIWQTPSVRYLTYLIIGCVGLLAVRTAVGMLEPPNAKDMTPRARTAHFDVICANPDCHRHFVIKRKFRFHRFPVTCPFCNKDTGRLALRCPSPTCGGSLQPTHKVDGIPTCDTCNRALRAPD